MNWMELVFLIGAALLIWVIVRMVRANPASFSKEALGKSFYTVGWLTLMIIVLVALCIILLRKFS